MSLISSIYNSSSKIHLDVKQSDKNSTSAKRWYKGKPPTCKCTYCNQVKQTKSLSKKQRKVFKRRTHPICNSCRQHLTKLGIYNQVLKEL